jgi:aspartyl-tRNA(Asn)/glutamyl-tRNA(Gln) amidotransferase subunit A
VSVADIAAEVRSGARTALSIAQAAIDRCRHDPYVCVTRTLEERALRDAERVDGIVANGGDPGPLAGVPFGVKDLFDVAGIPTTAGAAMRAHSAPAEKDAEAIRRLRAAGAVLVATLNMDEYAYGFATINAAYGTTRNPHDPERLAGGSSGGSAAAVAGGLLPLTLGSDTNGSIRVPAALCGLYGLKPTHGTLPMAGAFPFVDSFDDIGPFASSVADLHLAWEMLGGQDRPAAAAPRLAHLGGWFGENVSAELSAAIAQIAPERAELPEVARARSAAFLMTAAEGGARHLPELRRRAMAFDPQVRDRLLAGAMLPAPAYLAAQKFRSWFAARAAELFERYDVLIAPAAGDVAPRIDDPMVTVKGARVPARAHLGLFAQPISFIGLPVIAAPLKRPGQLPLGIQLIGAPGSEATLFAVAARLETQGMIGSSAPGF